MEEKYKELQKTIKAPVQNWKKREISEFLVFLELPTEYLENFGVEFLKDPEALAKNKSSPLKSKIQPEEEEKKPKKSKTKKNKNSSDEDDDHDEQKNQNKKQFNVDDEDEHTLHKKKQLIKHQKNNSNNDDLFEEVQPGLINNSKYAHNKKPIFEETKNNNNVGIVGSKHQAQKLPKDLEPKQKKEKRPLNMIPEAEALREITTNIEEIQSQILQRGDNSQNPNQRSMELVNENQINAIIPKKQLHKLTLQLLLKKNNEPPQYYFYEDFSIGAAETNGLVLDVNPQEGLYGDISDVHCVVKINPQGLFELEDCGSEFGTFYQLNSDQKYILEEGQIYQIGKTFIKINMMENDKMKFEVLKGEDKGKEFEIGCKKFIFGSKKKSDFEIKKDKWVSGSHCIFKRKKNGGFSVIDDNSTNGTWKKINEGEKLQLIPEVNVKLGLRTVLYIVDTV